MEKRLLGVVRHAVGDDEVEVVLEVLQAPVAVKVDSFSHGGKVHGVLDVVQVVRNLQETRDMLEAADRLRRSPTGIHFEEVKNLLLIGTLPSGMGSSTDLLSTLPLHFSQ